MGKRLRVCITLEGSYPYITGGVSAWVHQLINELSEIDFLLYTISPSENQPLRYKLPANVIYHKDFPISISKSKDVKISKDRYRKIEKLLLEKSLNIENFTRDSLFSLISYIPLGFNPLSSVLNSDKGWEKFIEQNGKYNPVYPFSEYFWAWKSSYDLVFSIIGQELPDADIYHALSTGFAGLAALSAKVRNGKPFILTEHGLYHKEREIEIRKADFVKGNQRDMWIRMYNSLSKLCYSSADVITSLFELNRHYQIELGADAKKSLVIPNGIDIKKFSVKREKRKGLHIGLVGRVVPIKDIKTYITMAKLLVDKIPEVHFYCIGPTDEDPHYFFECQNLVKSFNLEDCFTFTGRTNVIEYYSFLDILLLTSIREAQPLVILEAWVAGVPVVSTKVGNVAEMLDYNEKLLSPSKDPQGLAKSVLFLYSNPDYSQELIKRYKSKVETFNNKELLHNRIRNLYMEVG